MKAWPDWWRGSKQTILVVRSPGTPTWAPVRRRASRGAGYSCKCGSGSLRLWGKLGQQGSPISACVGRKPASVKSASQWPAGLGGSAGHSLSCCSRRRLTSQIETIAPPIGHRQRAAHGPSCALKTPLRRHIIAGGYLRRARRSKLSWGASRLDPLLNSLARPNTRLGITGRGSPCLAVDGPHEHDRVTLTTLQTCLPRRQPLLHIMTLHSMSLPCIALLCLDPELQADRLCIAIAKWVLQGLSFNTGRPLCAHVVLPRTSLSTRVLEMPQREGTSHETASQRQMLLHVAACDGRRRQKI